MCVCLFSCPIFYGTLVKPFKIVQKSRPRLWENSSKGSTGPPPEDRKIDFLKSAQNRLIFCTLRFSAMGNTNKKFPDVEKII